MAIDPNGWDVNSLKSRSQEIDASLKKQEEEQRIAAEQQEAATKQKAEETAMAKDSHAAKPANQFGVKENFKEIGNALTGGIRDTASSIITAPERAADMANGQMEQAGEDYKPDFDPLGADKNPLNKTWWGQLLRGGVHFGTMSAAVIVGSKVPGVSKIVSKVGSTGAGKFVANNSLAKAAALGAVSDTVSEYSQGDNAGGAFAKRFPWLDTPLATHDSDHPAMKTLKNVAEGMGIGILFDGLGMAIGKTRDSLGMTNKPGRESLIKADKVMETKRAAAEEAAKQALDKQLRKLTTEKLNAKAIDFNKLTPEQQIEQMIAVQKKNKGYTTWSPPSGETNVQRATRKAEERSKNVEDQVVEKAELELNEPDFRGHKNKPIADPWQGSPNSASSAYDVSKQLKRNESEWGGELGSTDSLVTPAAAERMAASGYDNVELEQLAKSLLGDNRFQGLLNELKGGRQTFQQTFGDAMARMQEVMGRDATGMTPEDFWGPMMRDQAQTGGKDNLEYWAIENVLAADLVNSSLFKQIRDLGIGSREIQSVADVMDVDGPVKTISDRLIVGLTNVKRSRYLLSDEFRKLQVQDPALAAKQRAARLAELHSETKESVTTMLQLAQEAPTDDFLQAILEAFSMSNKITNFTDFDKWMRGRLLGQTTEEGVKKTGALIKEMQGVMVHSILSGPKTPVRAVMGTATAAFTRPLATAVGSITRGDMATFRASLASTNAMVQAIPEAFTLFKTKLNSYWSGDISTIKTRYSEYSPSDEHWKLMEHWAETRGDAGEKAAFYVANMARGLNDNKFLTYSTKLMAATDDAFGLVLGRARAREKALREVMELKKIGDVTEINPDLVKAFEDRFMNEIFDADGNILDDALDYAKKEVTLTTDLTGFSRGLNDIFEKTPWVKPFFLFARTGINGLALTAKHTPFFNFMVKEWNDIAFASPDNLENVLKYGINNPTDLANAKALQSGRLVIGTAAIFTAGQLFMNGNLTGNGPQDRQKLQLWKDSGWKPRSVRLGDVWISYEAFEPFNQILAAVADLGDNLELMGPEYVEQNLLKYSLAIATAATSKSYLSGISMLVDLGSNDPQALAKIGANIANNTLPLGGLRNEISKVITPYTRELNSGIADAVRNRNLILEQITTDPLPIKYDLLNGKPINDWDFATRMFNAISPVQINLDNGPGRNLLFNSGYDMRLSVMSSPNGVSLAKDSKVRSLYQRAIGNQNLEKTLNELANRRDVQESIQQMVDDRNNNRRVLDPMKAYLHNDLIEQAFSNARKKGWAEIQNYPEVQRIVKQKTALDLANINSRQGNSTRTQAAVTQFLNNKNR